MAEKITSDDQKINVVNLEAETDEIHKDGDEVSFLRLVMTVTLAGLISGAIIIGIYRGTLPTITANNAREVKEAVFQVLSGVTQMEKLVMRGGKLVATQKIEKGEQPIYAGYDSHKNFVGYALPAEGPGFQDTIKLIYGYLPDSRRIVGMKVLDSRETPGLGDKITKDPDFLANFKSLAVDPEIVAVKKGHKTTPNEIDAITGATISSKSVVRILNNNDRVWLSRLPDKPPELKETTPQEGNVQDRAKNGE